MLSANLMHEDIIVWWVREPGIHNETELSAQLSNYATAGYPVIRIAMVGCCDTEREGLRVCLFVVLKQK